jgi:hypothetical protein
VVFWTEKSILGVDIVPGGGGGGGGGIGGVWGGWGGFIGFIEGYKLFYRKYKINYKNILK